MSKASEQPPPLNNISKRNLLRQETQHYHVKLNQHPLLCNLTTSDYPLANYQKVLRAYSGIYQILETQIERFLSAQQYTFSYSERRKLPWLLKDLAFFNIDAMVVDPFQFLPEAFPNINSPGELMGALYVIEGSTLGGQHISRALVKFHGLTSDRGACFFNGYGERTLALWEEFIDLMETVISDKYQFELANNNACQTFKLFQLILDNGLSL